MKLIDKLPTSYDQINYKDYIKIINLIPNEQPSDWDIEEYNSFQTLAPLSVLLDMPIIDLERLPAIELMPLIQKVSFMNEPFKKADSALNLRTAKELTYDQFVNYQNLRIDQWVNMPAILNIIIKDKTPEEIDQLSINEVMQAFFTLSKSTKSYLNGLTLSLGVKLMKQLIVQQFQKMKLWVTRLFSNRK